MSELVPTDIRQFSEWEFEMLARSGSDLFHTMLNQRVRIHDRETKSGVDFMQNCYEYLEINVTKQYFIRKGYRHATVYFESPVDMQNFQRVLASI
jgi:hypothetical protein